MNGVNDYLILISGFSGTGKSASLRNIPNQERWILANTEAGKRLPFKNNFKTVKVDDPMKVLAAFDEIINHPDDYDGIIIDSLTFLMEMYESVYVLNSTNTMKGWSNYNQFFKEMLQDKVVKCTKPVIFTAHVADQLDDKEMVMKTVVPVKGALKNQSVESYFSLIVSSKVLPLKELEGYENDLLHITEEDKDLGYKYVFQTRKTAKTIGERIRSPMGMFDKAHTYIDNDVNVLLNYLKSYYGD